VLNNIAPQTSNILYVQFFGAGGSGEGYLNSMSLSVVPDPSVWDGGGTNNGWSADNNWNPNGAPANDGTAYIVFGGTARLTPSVDVTWNVASIAFDNTAGPFTIDGPDRLTISAGGVTNNGANTQTIAAAITLSANQSFTAAAGDLVLNNVDLASRALIIAGVHDVELRDVTGPGTITKTDAGILEFVGSVGIGDIAVSANGGVTVFRESQTLSALSIGDGATVTLAASAGALLPVPEPAAASLLLSGALALCGRRRTASGSGGPGCTNEMRF
jgi:adhesin HecA-like repeat protein